MSIVPAQPDDADALGRVHVQAWRETYPGIVPDHVLAALDPAARAAFWARTIAAGALVLLARDPDGTILGFAAAGPQREPDVLPQDGEIEAIYLLRAARRRGLGRALMRGAAAGLRARGFAQASLWVLDGNADAFAFYAALGGLQVHHRSFQARGWSGSETAFAWPDLARLAAP